MLAVVKGYGEEPQSTHLDDHDHDDEERDDAGP
jgi:hypothetical protein